MNTVLLVGGLLILMIGLGNGIANYRWHQARKQLAEQAGWRYSARGKWGDRWGVGSRHFTVVGTSSAGILWELWPAYPESNHYLIWKTHATPLPYGKIVIFSTTQTVPALLAQAKDSQQFLPKPFQLYTSHDSLVNRYMPATQLPALQPFLNYPQPSSLAQLDWNIETLTIQIRYLHKWQTIEQLITLGETLCQHVITQINTQPSK